MAVLIEAFTLIVKRDAVERLLGDDVEAFARLVPNQTFAMDDHLFRLGFMVSADAYWYIDHVLRPLGIVQKVGEQSIDMTLVQQGRGPDWVAPWLELGDLPFEGGAVPAAWLTGTLPGPVRAYAGYRYDPANALTYVNTESSTGDAPSASHPGVNEVVDPESGRTIYTRRLYSSEGARAPFEPDDQPTQEFLSDIMVRAVEVLNAPKPRTWDAESARWSALLAGLERDLARLHVLTQGMKVPSPHCRLAEGLVLMALGRYSEAERALRIGHALAPHFQDIHGELIASLSYQGKYEDAIATGQRFLSLAPDNEGIAVNLAVVMHAAGSAQAGIELLEQFLVRNPGAEGAREFRGRMLAAKAKPRGLLARLFGGRR